VTKFCLFTGANHKSHAKGFLKADYFFLNAAFGQIRQKAADPDCLVLVFCPLKESGLNAKRQA
jgi:hypothetical protein